MDAASLGAGIVGAKVVVLAIHRRAGRAASVLAEVRKGAEIAIITGKGVVGVDAASFGAGIVGAKVVVLANSARPPTSVVAANFAKAARQACDFYIVETSCVIVASNTKSARNEPGSVRCGHDFVVVEKTEHIIFVPELHTVVDIIGNSLC